MKALGKKENRVAVYGTLKQGYGNHRVMEHAKGRLLGEDYVQIESLGECGFPYIKMSDTSDKWLKVEVYGVTDENMHHVDALEGYVEGREDNHYNRIAVQTLGDVAVYVYEYHRSITEDTMDRHFTHQVPSPKFYDWKR